MQKIILYTIVIVFSLVTKAVAQELETIEKSTEWMARGSKPESYEMGLLKNSTDKAQKVFTIRSIDEKIEGFGNLMQSSKPDLYLGKTIKMSGYVKSENVKSWAGLWMRIDYYNDKVLAFDNMQNRAIKGTNDWTKYEVVLFVPQDATDFSYGVLLDGTGQIWFKDIQLEIVDDSIPETGITKGRNSKSISFEDKAKAIANSIEMITTEEKNALKKEVEAIDLKVKEGEISAEKAQDLKSKIAQERANNIETKVAIEEAKLAQLVQDKVDGKIFDSDEKPKRGGTKIVLGSNKDDSIGENKTEINFGSMKIYNGEKDKAEKRSKRTTSQFVFAFGLNNVITDGENLEDSDYRVWGSHFYEWGVTYNSRIFKNNNLLHAKYGLSLMYNNLRPTDNRYFVKNGDQTDLVTSTVKLDDSRFRNVYLTAPLHLEFDFTPKKLSKDGTKTYFRTHESVRLGIGGYGGVRIKSKQILKYEVDDIKVKEKQKGDFNVSDFTYGLSAYVGYGQTSLYVKYDLNPMFKNNNIDQNNVSLGLRFDFN
ncbi:hypothetical protein [Flavobacterium cheniae]|uniref:Outer membrane protein with beta-barrel domain n=1 Tax=Flavobacterium cheniae TaxID=295428 RepID=A0A562KB39_9FLAO|nr:hypothetical protein [Flavobacterium cheniae]TDR24076.1 hypothetical protein C8D80_1105 [Flavobacterium cheniae]TWH92640.1 hypothetical protein IP97_02384 [Flavobacterium cheniae]